MASESLAAESYREGGAFESNVGAQPENLSASEYNQAPSGKLDAAPNAEYRERAHDTTSHNASSYDKARGTEAQSHAGTAPSYISSQYARDTSGPHGKNIHEGFDDSGVRDGLQAALAAEPGSQDDPSRLAEQQYKLNQNAKSRSAGPKQTGLSTETKYDVLKDTSA